MWGLSARRRIDLFRRSWMRVTMIKWTNRPFQLEIAAPAAATAAAAETTLEERLTMRTNILFLSKLRRQQQQKLLLLQQLQQQQPQKQKKRKIEDLKYPSSPSLSDSPWRRGCAQGSSIIIIYIL